MLTKIVRYFIRIKDDRDVKEREDHDKRKKDEFVIGIPAVELPEGIERPELGPISTGLGEVFHYVLRSDNPKRTLDELRTLQEITEKIRIAAQAHVRRHVAQPVEAAAGIVGPSPNFDSSELTARSAASATLGSVASV